MEAITTSRPTEETREVHGKVKKVISPAEQHRYSLGDDPLLDGNYIVVIDERHGERSLGERLRELLTFGVNSAEPPEGVYECLMSDVRFTEGDWITVEVERVLGSDGWHIATRV